MSGTIRIFILVIFMYCKSLMGQVFYYGGAVGYGSTPSMGVKNAWCTWVGSNITPKRKLSPYVGVQMIRLIPDNGTMFQHQGQVGLTYMGFTGYYGIGNVPSVGVSFNAGYQLFRFEYIYNENIFMVGGGYRLW